MTANPGGDLVPNMSSNRRLCLCLRLCFHLASVAVGMITANGSCFLIAFLAPADPRTDLSAVWSLAWKDSPCVIDGVMGGVMGGVIDGPSTARMAASRLGIEVGDSQGSQLGRGSYALGACACVRGWIVCLCVCLVCVTHGAMASAMGCAACRATVASSVLLPCRYESGPRDRRQGHPDCTRGRGAPI